MTRNATPLAQPISSTPRGLTLIELLVTVAISITLLAIAVPQMRELIARKRVAGVANELASDIRYARAQVVEQNQPIWINFGSTADFTCYVISTEGGLSDFCNCTRAPGAVCAAGPLPAIPLKIVYVQRSSHVTVSAAAVYLRYLKSVGAPNIPFSGTASATVTGDAGSGGGTVNIDLNTPVGVKLCSPSGQVSEFGACTP